MLRLFKPLWPRQKGTPKEKVKVRENAKGKVNEVTRENRNGVLNRDRLGQSNGTQLPLACQAQSNGTQPLQVCQTRNLMTLTKG